MTNNHHTLTQHIDQDLRTTRDTPLITVTFLKEKASPFMQEDEIVDALISDFHPKWLAYGIADDVIEKLTHDHQLLKIIAKGNVELLRYILCARRIALPSEALELAIEYKQINMVQCIVEEKNQKLTRALLDQALQRNHITAELARYFLEHHDTPSLDLSPLHAALPDLLGNANVSTVQWALDNNIAPTQEAILDLLNHIDPRLHAFLNAKKNDFPVKEEALTLNCLQHMEQPFFDFLNPNGTQGDLNITYQETKQILKKAAQSILMFNPHLIHQLITQGYLQPTEKAFNQLGQAEMFEAFWLLLDQTPQHEKIDCITAFYEHLPNNGTTQAFFESLKNELELNVVTLSIR